MQPAQHSLAEATQIVLNNAKFTASAGKYIRLDPRSSVQSRTGRYRF